MFSEGFFRDFFEMSNRNVNPAGRINRQCPKCGVPLAAMEWDPFLKEIKLSCVGGCRYCWRVKPLDSEANRQGKA